MANNLGIDLTGKKVIVSVKGYESIGSTEADRTFLCKAGFGLKPFTMGECIYGHFVNHPELGEGRIEGSDVEKLADSGLQEALIDAFHLAENEWLDMLKEKGFEGDLEKAYADSMMPIKYDVVHDLLEAENELQ